MHGQKQQPSYLENGIECLLFILIFIDLYSQLLCGNFIFQVVEDFRVDAIRRLGTIETDDAESLSILIITFINFI